MNILKKNGYINNVNPSDVINYLTSEGTFCGEEVTKNQVNNLKKLIKGKNFVNNKKLAKNFELYCSFIKEKTTRLSLRCYLLGSISHGRVKYSAVKDIPNFYLGCSNNWNKTFLYAWID